MFSHQTLKERTVLAVYGQDRNPGFSCRGHDDGARHHQGFFVGQGDGLVVANGIHGGPQASKTDQGGQYNVDFIQYPTLKNHHKVFLGDPRLSWGHLLFGDMPAVLLKDVRHILLVRDPYDWVLARTRFFLSDNFQANLDHIKGGRTSIDDFMNMMIFGVHNLFPTMNDIYLNNAVAWLGTSAKLVRYEEIVQHLKNLDSPEAEFFFKDLLGFGDIALPADWKDRVRVGSDRKQSGTARENLSLKGVEIPKDLPDMQKRLVDHTNPGLRAILGYE